MSGADVAESTTAPAPLNPAINDSAAGHERSGFVQPRTYLEPAEPIIPAKPELTFAFYSELSGLS